MIAGRWLVVGLVAAAVLFPSPVSVPLAAALLLVVAGSRWLVRRAASGLQASCEVPPWAGPDEPLAARVRLSSATRLPAAWLEVDVPCALGLGRTAPHRSTVTLGAGEPLAYEIPLRGTHRGRHRVGPVRVRLGDVLGCAVAQVDTAATAEVTVFPRIVPLERLGLPSSSPFVAIPSRRQLLADQHRVRGVRGYEAGDPLTAIHWPASARTGALMVKQYEWAESRDTLVCLDLSSGGYARGTLQASVELAIVVAASVLHHAVMRNGLPAGLAFAPWERGARDIVAVEPRDDRRHLRQLLELLAEARPDARTPLAATLSRLGRSAGAGTTVLAVTGRLDADAAAQLLLLERAGVSVAVALTGPSAADDDLTVGQLWLPVYRIPDVPDVTRMAA